VKVKISVVCKEKKKREKKEEKNETRIKSLLLYKITK
jgi:hypothetical protein